MMRKPVFKIFTALLTIALVGCASKPNPRQEITPLPSVENGWGRLYLTAGKYRASYDVDARLKEHVGPVFINNQNVGAVAYREYIAVDILPGTYEAYCTPEEPLKNIPEKRQLVVKAGDQQYLACDVVPKGAAGFGLLGLAVADYISATVLVERPLASDSKLVGYFKIKPSSNSPDVEAKLKQLQKLRKDRVITEQEFNQKKKAILNQM